jgi:hypothetical protein
VDACPIPGLYRSFHPLTEAARASEDKEPLRDFPATEKRRRRVWRERVATPARQMDAKVAWRFVPGADRINRLLYAHERIQAQGQAMTEKRKGKVRKGKRRGLGALRFGD